MWVWHPYRNCVLFLLVAIVLFSVRIRAEGASSAPDSPVGRWKTIDDKTGQAKATVEIREANGELEGHIIQLFHPPVPHPECIKCTGALKNEPVMGMRILWGMRQNGSEWTGGHVLDPESGNIYHCTIAVEQSGKVLRLRGYVGLSVFGRTEKWLRLDNGTE